MAGSETLAAARADALLRTMATEAGATVLSSRSEAKRDEADVAGRIEVQAVVEAENDDLQALLLKIEGGVPLMLVEDLSIQPAGGGTGEASDTASPRLHATMTLSAYWQAGPK